MMKTILIAAFASNETGTGHVRRMLTLADALISAGQCKIIFLTNYLGARIAKANASSEVEIINNNAKNPALFISGLEALLPKLHPDILILDNYFWNAENETSIRKNCGKLVVIDDLADRPHIADLLLDQNANREEQDYRSLTPRNSILAIGARFCLLSKPFQTLRKAGIIAPEDRLQRNKVFLSLGGGDPQNDLLRITKMLINETELQLSIATGSHIQDAEKLRKLADNHPKRIELALDSHRVAEQMNECGFALASGGTMTWERASIGLPSLCLLLADNQLEASSWLATRGYHTVFDMRSNWEEQALMKVVEAYAENKEQRIQHSKRSASLIDSWGARRTAELIMKLATLHETAMLSK